MSQKLGFRFHWRRFGCSLLLDDREVHWEAQTGAGPQLPGRQEATPQGARKLRLLGRCAEGVGAAAQAWTAPSHIGKATGRCSLGLHHLQETTHSEHTARTEHHCPHRRAPLTTHLSKSKKGKLQDTRRRKKSLQFPLPIPSLALY